jgi:hypothetical protein
VSWQEDFWRAWFGVHGGREAGSPHRTFLETAEELITFIRKRPEGGPRFMSVQPYRMRNQVCGLEKLFFDFDCEKNLGKAWSEASQFVGVLKRFYGLQPFIVFSGHKGYHVYVWLWRVVEFTPGEEAYAKEIYQRLQTNLLKGLKYETLDTAVLGDIKRLARVPYTLHEKTGLLCEPVAEDRRPLLAQPQALNGYREHGVPSSLFHKIAEQVRAFKKFRSAVKQRCKISQPPLRCKHVRPCISSALNSSLDGELGHKMRLAAAAEYLNRGFRVEEVVQLFHTQSDFDENKTRYFVKDAKEKRYKPFKRSTLKQLGFCLGRFCSACIKAGRIVF